MSTIMFPTPPPIIRQHLNNAIFYYKTLYESRYSSLINVDKFNYFNALLNANIDGLCYAKEKGLDEARIALLRWKGHEEAFIYTLLFNELDSEKEFDSFWLMIKELGFNAVIGSLEALLRVEINARTAQLALLKEREPDIFIVALLKIKAHHQELIHHDKLLYYLNLPSKEIKIALCYYVKKMKLISFSENIRMLVNSSTDIAVKYAAIDAMCWLSNDNEYNYIALSQLLPLYLEENTPKGNQSLIHSQKIENLVRLMGCISSTNNKLIAPPSLYPEYLNIIYYTHSCHAEYLPDLINYLDNPELSRLAYKGICILTGIDVNSPELTYSSPEKVELAVDSRVRFLSSGVNNINIKKVKETIKLLNLKGKIILGKPVSIQHCEKIIKKGYQLERHIANWHLCHMNKENKYNNFCFFNRIKNKELI